MKILCLKIVFLFMFLQYQCFLTLLSNFFTVNTWFKCLENTLFAETAKLKCREIQFFPKNTAKLKCRENFLPRKFHAIKYKINAVPGRYVFTSYESTLHSKLEQLVNGVMVDYHKKVQEMEAKNKKKKKSKKVEK